MKQLKLLASQPSDYGGELRRTRKGRSRGRPISSRETMHLVLRSEKAQGPRAFNTPQNRQLVARIIGKFAQKHGVKILSAGTNSNHLHLHVKLMSRFTYKPFIRAVTAAIAMSMGGASRWNKLKEKFWDFRPFSRVARGRRGFLAVRDYVELNELEGLGFIRATARWILGKEKGDG